MGRARGTVKEISNTAKPIANSKDRETKVRMLAAIGITAQALITAACSESSAAIETFGAQGLLYHPAFKRTSRGANRFHLGLQKNLMVGWLADYLITMDTNGSKRAAT